MVENGERENSGEKGISLRDEEDPPSMVWRGRHGYRDTAGVQTNGLNAEIKIQDPVPLGGEDKDVSGPLTLKIPSANIGNTF